MCILCEELESKINKTYPNADWNIDDACRMWCELSSDIPNNHIQFQDGADENYGCTCPSCGRMICGWCV